MVVLWDFMVDLWDLMGYTRPGNRSQKTNWKDPPCKNNGKIHDFKVPCSVR
jgi:hypothetical protein